VAPTWERWVQARDALSKELGSVRSELDRSVRKDVLRILDDEMGKAMEGAAMTPGLEGVADKFRANAMGMRIAEELTNQLDEKAAKALLNNQPSITPRDAAMTAASAMAGSPGMGLTWLLGKGVANQLQTRMEPAIAQMAYDMSIGSKAAEATMNAKSQIQSSMRGFFKKANKATGEAPAKAAQVKNASKSERLNPRKEVDDAHARTEQLLSAVHQDKVRRYAKELETQGYGELATAMLGVNQRAVMYLMNNLPPSQKAKGIGSLRSMPASAVPSLQEYKFLRINKGVSNPTAVLKDIEEGNVSRDEIKAFKYVYPEMYAEVVTEATNQVYEMKMKGDSLPLQKISQLGVVLDAPVDSILQPDYVGAVQMALNAPPVNEEPPPPPANSGITPQDLMTVTQQIQSV
jgi:hypothetical protein